MDRQRLDLLRLLSQRLERLSVDSVWARRASGLRGNMLRVLEEADSGGEVPSAWMDTLIDKGFDILRHAASEIPDLEDLRKKGKGA
ncbi:MAG: hypothetical protein ABIJ39_12445 [Chloroflexota bacterium]